MMNVAIFPLQLVHVSMDKYHSCWFWGNIQEKLTLQEENLLGCWEVQRLQKLHYF